MENGMSDEVEKKLAKMQERLESLEEIISNAGITKEPSMTGGLPPSIKDLLDLPDTIRRTLLALQGLGESTSEEVSKKTGRTRSIETVYLNQLHRLKHVSRQRKSRKVYYKVVRYY